MRIAPPDTDKLKGVNDYPSFDQLMILKDLCHKIYIARNITLDQNVIMDNLKRIDILFRDTENYN